MNIAIDTKDAIRQAIINGRARGLTFLQIVDELGVTLDIVRYHADRLRSEGLLERTIYKQHLDGPWSNPEFLEKFKALYDDPAMTFGKIASALGNGISRSAVIAKAHRMGWPRRGTTRPRIAPIRPQRAKRKTGKPNTQARLRSPMRVQPVAAKVAPGEVLPLPRAEVWHPLPGVPPVRLDHLELRHCRWPIEVDGEAYGLDSLFCGADVPADITYCATHAAVARRRVA